MGIRLSLLTWAGRILNLAGFPGWIRSGSHESEFGTVQVRVSALYTVVTVNGVRVTVEDGTWGLVRASSNKPELVVVVESPASEARMREMFAAVDKILRENPEVGAYNQTI